MAGQSYPTWEALEDAIRETRHRVPRNVEFFSELIAQAINRFHPDVANTAFAASGFFNEMSVAEMARRSLPHARRYRGGDVFFGHFWGFGWTDVTAYPWKYHPAAPVQRCVSAFREFVNEHLLPSPGAGDHCVDAGAHAHTMEYDHVTPTFATIADAALRCCSPIEIATGFGYQKFVTGRYGIVDWIPADHPALQALRAAHTGNEWAWRCRSHHRARTRQQQAEARA